MKNKADYKEQIAVAVSKLIGVDIISHDDKILLRAEKTEVRKKPNKPMRKVYFPLQPAYRKSMVQGSVSQIHLKDILTGVDYWQNQAKILKKAVTKLELAIIGIIN